MKLNLGCGSNHLDGHVNIDREAACQPDRIIDLEQTPWDLPSDCADEIKLHHVLEHLGQETACFLAIIKELYRIAKDRCSLDIRVPHPLHSDFRTDPTHVRMVTPETLSMFSKANCNFWNLLGAANTPLAHIHNVDFEITNVEFTADSDVLATLQRKGLITEDEDLTPLSDIFPGLFKEICITMLAKKTASLN